MAFLVMLVLAVVAAAVVIGVFGMMVAGLVMAVKLIPLLLVGYVVVKVIQRVERPRGALTVSERSWLDTRG